MQKLTTTVFLLFLSGAVFSQTGFVVTGKVTEADTEKPMPNATVHLKGSNFSTLSKIDGSFRIHTTEWYDSLEITSVGFSLITVALQQNHTTGISVIMQSKPNELQAVVVGVSKRPGKSFMQQVIEHKNNNNPSRFRSYSYQRYSRNELDIDNIDFQKAKGNGLKSILLKTYTGVDSTVKDDKELPIYFDETLANNYHSVSPDIEQENIIASS